MTAESEFGKRYISRDETFALVLVLLFGSFAIWGVPLVPFHPDETTYLYMSSDYPLFITQPGALSWRLEEKNDPRNVYRLIDPALPRWLIGLSQQIGKQPPMKVDWDWSNTWEENNITGALPDANQLFYGRLLITLLIPLDLMLVFLIGKQMQGSLTGLLAMVLFGTNALILLHARRAMSEGLLVFGILLSLWLMVRSKRNPWIVGLGTALAINSKLSAVGLIPVCLLFCVFCSRANGEKCKRSQTTNFYLTAGIILTVGFITSALLNPVFWKHPVEAIREAIELRSDLAARQIADREDVEGENFSETIRKRGAAMLAHLFLMPPVFSETSNYREETHQVEAAYLQFPGHNIFRGLPAGSLLLVMSIFGMIAAALQTRKKPSSTREAILISLFATACLAAVIFFLMGLPWQRYVLPLVPLACLWSAFGITVMVDSISNTVSSNLH